MRRRLAAVLCADVVEYTRLMHEDETATHETYRRYWEEVLEPSVRDREGRVVKSTGDGFIAEFDSVVNAVECAMVIQREVESHNLTLRRERRVKFRIAIDSGEIIVENDDIFGDHVNVAARLQEFAPPGGICVSRTVRDEVKRTLPIRFDDLGPKRLKNISNSVRIYGVDPHTEWRPSVANLRVISLIRSLGRGAKFMLGVVPIVVVLGVVLGVTSDQWSSRTRTAAIETSSRMNPRLSLPDEPSIAVLAFLNMHRDPRHEYFAEGISADIITDLSRLPGLFVIARNSSFYYKDKSKTTKQIGQELGVRYIVAGSVQRASSRVRIRANLIDATTGGNVWSHRYDKKLSGIFELQDEIRQAIVEAIASKLLVGQKEGTRNVEAYDAYLLGWSHLRKTKPIDTAKAVELFNSAIVYDPGYALAHAALAAAYLQATRHLWHKNLGLESEFDSESLALQHIELAMQSPSALAFRVRAELNYREGLYRKAFADIAQARAMAPNDAEAIALLGRVNIKVGRAEDAIEPLLRAQRLDPNQPVYTALLGIAEFARGNYAAAVRHIENAFQRNPEDHVNLEHLISAYAHLNNLEKARSLLATMNAMRDKAAAEPYTLFVAARSPVFDERCDLFRLREGLRLVDVPKGPEPEPPVDGTNCSILPAK